VLEIVLKFKLNCCPQSVVVENVDRKFSLISRVARNKVFAIKIFKLLYFFYIRYN